MSHERAHREFNEPLIGPRLCLLLGSVRSCWLPSADLRSLPLAAILAGQPRRDPKPQALKLRGPLQHAAAALLAGPASRGCRHERLFRSCLHRSSDTPYRARRRLRSLCPRGVVSGRCARTAALPPMGASAIVLRSLRERGASCSALGRGRRGQSHHRVMGAAGLFAVRWSV